MTHTQQYRQADRLATQLHKDPFTVLDAIANADPIRTPAPNPTPTATADGLGLPTPPVLSAQTQARQASAAAAAWQASLRRAAVMLAEMDEITFPVRPAAGATAVSAVVPTDDISYPPERTPTVADLDYEDEQARYQQERDNEMDWD